MAASQPLDPMAAPLEAAAAWRVRLAEAAVETSPAHQRWLAEHPHHREAWAAVQSLWTDIGGLATEPELLAARRDALERARRASRARWPRGGLSRRIAAGAAAAVVLAAGAGYGGWRTLQPDHYATGLGERRIVRLEDGSVVSLDSGTRLDVRFTPSARDLWLRDGQARFDVAHDVARPFKVRAKDRTVVATGTSFNVEVLGAKVLVTLLEGRVTVLRGAQPAGALRRPPPATVEVSLTPGQQLVADVARPASSPRVAAVDPDRATAWQSGKLVFDDEPLAGVVEQVSRYSARPVSVADPRTAALRVSGVFSAGDLDTFVDIVTGYLPVDARTAPDGSVVLRSRG